MAKSKEKKVSLICSIVSTILCIIGILLEYFTTNSDYTLWIILLICNCVLIFLNARRKDG